MQKIASTQRRPVRRLDATRVQDEQQVMFKMLVPPTEGDEGKNEYALLKYFSSPSLKDDPDNHVVPCLDSFPIPGVSSGQFVVMPLLSRYNNIPFYNLAEVHDFLQQLFKGLAFMHRNNTAHLDIASPNVMMDARPLYDEPFHPFYQTLSLDATRLLSPRYRRSEMNTRYYYIDLGYSVRFEDSTRQTVGSQARELAPEQETGLPFDPVMVDVYQLGKMIERDLIPKIKEIQFLEPLVRQMTRTNPAERPTLVGAQASMNTAFLGLSGWRYRWPIIPQEAELRERLRYIFAGLTAEVRWWLHRVLTLFSRRG
ncbi:unnamed protein product [Rhizoctonia solani]|uniref:Protein kinase domain-containing protein n=1 Tax=Rhizoctonia solani TaxID=456999 RepID=A0A8H2XR97_9AGAM|nr:unnamed protein product [Rhizoctonia solani]